MRGELADIHVSRGLLDEGIAELRQAMQYCTDDMALRQQFVQVLRGSLASLRPL